MSDYLMSDEEAGQHMARAKILLQEFYNANWTEEEAFFAVSFAYVFMCKASGETDDKLVERIAKIAAAMNVEPTTEQ